MHDRRETLDDLFGISTLVCGALQAGEQHIRRVLAVVTGLLDRVHTFVDAVQRLTGLLAEREHDLAQLVVRHVLVVVRVFQGLDVLVQLHRALDRLACELRDLETTDQASGAARRLGEPCGTTRLRRLIDLLGTTLRHSCHNRSRRGCRRR